MAYTTIDDPSAYFQVALHTGNGGTQSITNDGNSDLQPDLVWIKGRSTNSHHALFDSVRSATKRLSSSENNAETTESTGLTSFNSDGWSTGAWSGSNSNTKTYVSWQWKESTVAGLDIIAYTGQGISTAFDVSHNLSAVPDWIMIKNRSVDQAWRVYSKSMGFSNRLVLSESGAKSTSALGLDADPTSSVINIGTGTGCTNASGENFICYAFKNVKGFSKAFSYSGNGNSDGSYIHLGFRASFIMIKATSGSENFRIYDNKRNGFNVDNEQLFANIDSIESSDADLDILANGFKCRRNSGGFNNSGTTYIGIAFAEFPFVTSTGVPTTAR
jgi:hypothetical protein